MRRTVPPDLGAAPGLDAWGSTDMKQGAVILRIGAVQPLRVKGARTESLRKEAAMPRRFLMKLKLLTVLALAAAGIAFAEEAANDTKPDTPEAGAPKSEEAPQGAAQSPAPDISAPVPEQSAAPAPEAPAAVKSPEPVPKSVLPSAPRPVIESGLASVYSSDLEGRLTASGAPYDSQQLTAAHRTLPLGSQIRVTDVALGRSVVVTVNDRWGGGPGQVVNLSRRAADELGMRGSGQRKVDIALETLGEGRRAPAAPGYAANAPQLLPERIEATSTDSAARVRSCQNEANILGLQDMLREVHVRNCLGRKSRDGAAQTQVKAKR
jgi:rare lipoprotein A (peptidoglycan hydrolase)